MKANFNILLLLAALLAFNFSFAQTSDKETVMAAEKFFKAGNYTEALPLYAQLVSNHKTETKYAYNYGVCRYMRGVNVADAISYLEKAASNAATSKDVNYYLARCYHLTYHFSEAVTYYEKFKKTATTQQLTQWEIELNIAMCKNAVNLPDHSDRYLINDKKIVDENSFLSLYQLDPLRDGKILTMTDDYKSSADKKRNERQYLYLDASSSKLYYASRSVDGEQSSDILSALKKINKWDKATKIKEANSKYDEIHPTAAKDGKIIYFSAKSPQSMGGFDIFKMEYNAETGSYGKPENLGPPLNSPYDDYLYASSNIERTNYITTTRDCEKGKVCVIKFDSNEPTDGYLHIKGKFINNDRPNEFNVTIQYFNPSNWKALGEARVDTKTGEYTIKLPYAPRYGCKIDVVGYSLLLGDFVLRRDKKTVYQEIILNKQNNGQERLVIRNTYPEDAQLIFATNTPKEIKPETISKATTLSKAINNETKNLHEIKRTVNWKNEKLLYASALKPKEDKEILGWIAEEKNKQPLAVVKKQVAKKEEIPAFDLENISLTDLEKQTPTANKIVQVKAEGTEATGRTTQSIALAETRKSNVVNPLSDNLKIKNPNKQGSVNYIASLPPIGYEILDSNDKSKKEIQVAPIAVVEKPKEEKIKSEEKIIVKKSEEIKNMQSVKMNSIFYVSKDLLLKKNGRTGNVNYIKSLPDEKAEQSTELTAIEIAPVVKKESIALIGSRETMQLTVKQKELKLQDNLAKATHVNYIASLPEQKVEKNDNVLPIAKNEIIQAIQTKENTQLALSPSENKLKNKISKTGNVNYVKSLPELEKENSRAYNPVPVIQNSPAPITRMETVIASIMTKKIETVNAKNKQLTLTSVPKTGRVKLKLNVPIENELIAEAKPQLKMVKVDADETENLVNENKNEKTETAIVHLAPLMQKDDNTASLRYRFRAFENKSDAEVRGIISLTSVKGLGQ